MKIGTVIGARPQFIKAAMVSKEIAKHHAINEIIIHTGQHFDGNMSSIFFDEMGIPEPNYNLGIKSLSHGAMTGRQLEEIEKVLLKEKPDWVMVYGDTNSTLAGSLAAAKLDLPVAHVEAGLRSFNRKMPEEINRVLTDHIADLLFAPTVTAVNNIKHEGIDESKIKLVGDVMLDATLYFTIIAEKKSKILSELNLEAKEYILATVHRPENTEQPKNLKNIFSALANAPLPVVLPLHPRTKKRLQEHNIPINGQLNSIDPVGYLDMIMLEKNAYKIATDSGGIQKEAYFFNVPCITFREETEWVELIKLEANCIVGTNKKRIAKLLHDDTHRIIKKSIYGKGNTAEKIIKELK